MSTLSVDTIQGKTTAGTVAMPSGTTVQAQSLANSGRGAFVYTTSSSFAHVGTNWDLTITPKFTSSKILLLGNFVCIMNGGTNKYGYLTLYRSVGGSATDLGDLSNSGLMAVEGEGKMDKHGNTILELTKHNKCDNI